MKILLLGILLIGTAHAALGQSAQQAAAIRVEQFDEQRVRNMNAAMAQEQAAEAAEYQKQLEIQKHAAEIRQTISLFPWREIDGVTQHVAVTWCLFSGTILQVHPDGIRVDGEYHSIYPDHEISFTGEFFIKHYPFQQADGDIVPRFMAGLPCDVYTYNTAQGSMHTIHSLDFGIPCDAPPPMAETADQIAADNAAKAELENKKADALQRALDANETAAAQNDPYGLLRMGERYRDGDGVPKDLAKARDYLFRASQAGDLTASNELAQLTSQ